MRKHRNARTHWSSKAARRNDGMPNRALLRTMTPAQRIISIHAVVTMWHQTASALIPGYVPSSE